MFNAWWSDRYGRRGLCAILMSVLVSTLGLFHSSDGLLMHCALSRLSSATLVRLQSVSCLVKPP